MTANWTDKIIEYCREYSIPIEYLSDTLWEPKVVPMIRGKAFEYSVIQRLQSILPTNEWIVSKATAGEEAFYHDTDVRVFHKRTGRTLRLECKLSKKEGYQVFADGHAEIKVKCMRSRTLGDSKVKELAPKLGIDENALGAHRDQYVAADFDIVVTSIGNAFYRTDSKTHHYASKPKKTEQEFLIKLGCKDPTGIKEFAFNTMLIAKTKDLIASTSTGIICSKKQCSNNTNCGFIPNYPTIRFEPNSMQPSKPWLPIEQAQTFFKSIVLA
ncbi:MAG TPA: restriction endonuclease [Dehalococcoidia bacterium]|nr:restriction endonuclease [Dehalococcoidia bacterium]